MRAHRTLVFLDDETRPERWGYWCIDCPESKSGFKTELHPSRLAKRHEQETRPVLQEAS